MNLPLEFSIAIRYLKSKRKEGFANIVSIFSFLGITLGVATLIVTMAVMNGVKTELIERIIGINSHISIHSYEGKINDYEEIVEKISQLEGVKSVNASVHGQALATIGNDNIGIMIRGIKQEDIKSKELLRNSIISGEFYNNETFEAIIGSQFAKITGLSNSKSLKLISPKFNSSLFGTIPRLKDFQVTGVFDVGMYEYDSSVIFTSLFAAQKFLGLKNNQVNTIEIFSKNPKNLNSLKDKIYKTLRDDLYINDWEKNNANFIESINVQANVLFLILALIIIVAAFNIISGMVMLVGDKSKEIAILRTIGIEKTSVVRIFIISGFAIGLIGTLLGLLIGLAFASNINEIRLWLESLSNTNLFAQEIYFLSQLPAEIKVSDVINITGLSLSLSFISTIYPSYKASKTDPAEALKYE